MKAKFILLLAISAILTLSFTFVGIKGAHPSGDKLDVTTQSKTVAPVGGFISEDQL